MKTGKFKEFFRRFLISLFRPSYSVLLIVGVVAFVKIFLDIQSTEGYKSILSAAGLAIALSGLVLRASSATSDKKKAPIFYKSGERLLHSAYYLVILVGLKFIFSASVLSNKSLVFQIIFFIAYFLPAIGCIILSAVLIMRAMKDLNAVLWWNFNLESAIEADARETK